MHRQPMHFDAARNGIFDPFAKIFRHQPAQKVQPDPQLSDLAAIHPAAQNIGGLPEHVGHTRSRAAKRLDQPDIARQANDRLHKRPITPELIQPALRFRHRQPVAADRERVDRHPMVSRRAGEVRVALALLVTAVARIDQAAALGENTERDR